MSCARPVDPVFVMVYCLVQMTELLKEALEAVQLLPADSQDEIARAMLALAGGQARGEPVPLTAEERAAIARSKDAAARGEFASEEQVRAVWAKHDL